MKKSIFLFFVLIFNLCLSPVVYAADFADPFPLPELTGDWRTDYVAVAESQLGYTEAADGSSYFGDWADQTFRPWCSEFAAWCAVQAGIPETVIPIARSTGGYRNFFIDMDEYYFVDGGINGYNTDFLDEFDWVEIKTISISEAESGDLILAETDGDISNGPDHTAIFLSYENGVINCISGNSSDNVEYGIIMLENVHALCKPDFDNQNEYLEEEYIEENIENDEESENIVAENASANEVKVTIGSSEVIIGDEISSMDTAPYIQQSSNSVLVPLRFVSTAILGISDDITEDSLKILWNSDTKTATIMFDSIDFGSKIIQFTAGSSNMVINGTTIAMDSNVKAELTDGRMFVPFRALGTALGVNVSWDSDNRIASYTVQ